MIEAGTCLRRYSIASIMSARHDHEIRPDTVWHVHLDAAHIGSGGDDSWSPSVHKVTLPLQALGSLPRAQQLMLMLRACMSHERCTSVT